MDSSIQSEVQKSYNDLLTIPLSEVILYLKKQFGKRFILFVSQCEGDIAYFMKIPMDIEDEVRLRFTYKIGKTLVDAYGKKTARSWFFGTNQILGDTAPVSWLRSTKCLDTLKEVLAVAEVFCHPA